MQVQRCPECGGRLKTNYCDICLRKVPFKGVPAKQTFQHVEGSSAHRAEKNHECVSFDQPKKKTQIFQQPVSTRQRKPRAKAGVKKVSILVIVLAVFSVISSLFGLVESMVEDMEPEYNYDAFVTEADVPAIEKTELYNDGQILITADTAGLYYNDYTIAMTIENGSERDILVNTELLSVNGYMLGSGLNADVAEGETCQVFLSPDSYLLKQMGIDQVAQIAFYLNIYDSQDYADIGATELLTLQTDIADDYVQPPAPSGWELYNDGSVKLLLTGTEEMSAYGDCELDVYIENLSDSKVSVSTSAVWLNGQEVSGGMWQTLRPDTRAINSVYIYDLEDLEITELSQIEEISLYLQIEYMDGWDITESINESVTFNPNELFG